MKQKKEHKTKQIAKKTRDDAKQKNTYYTKIWTQQAIPLDIRQKSSKNTQIR